MPTKRRSVFRSQRARVSEDAVAAFRAGDWLALHRALHLAPWHTSPLDATTETCPLDSREMGAQTWADARALRLELEHAD